MPGLLLIPRVPASRWKRRLRHAAPSSARPRLSPRFFFWGVKTAPCTRLRVNANPWQNRPSPPFARIIIPSASVSKLAAWLWLGANWFRPGISIWTSRQTAKLPLLSILRYPFLVVNCASDICPLCISSRSDGNSVSGRVLLQQLSSTPV